MRIATILILAAVPAWLQGATVQTPPGCSTRPCTYAHTCAGATCTSGEVQELQAALNDAHLGDTILCEAGKTYPTLQLTITERPGTQGQYLDLQSSAFSQLPEAIITPEQAPATCTIAATSASSAISFPARRNGPAKWVRLRGLRMTMAAGNNLTHQEGLIRVGGGVAVNYAVDASDETLSGQPIGGWVQDGDLWSCRERFGISTHINYSTVNANGTTFQLALKPGGPPIDLLTDGVVDCRVHWTDEMQPDNIVLDRVLVTMDHPIPFSSGQVLGRGVLLDAKRVTVTRSWMDDVANGGDSQVILIASGGPYSVENNYFGAATENIMTGGTPASVLLPAPSGSFVGNIFAKPLRWRSEAGWEPSHWYEVGALRRPAALGGVQLQAQNSGFSGSAEPSWPTGFGETVSDFEITWERINFFTSTKNLFESKTGKGIRLERNGFYWTWKGAQEEAIVIKRSSVSSNGQETPSYRRGFVDTNGTTVTWVSGDKLPYLYGVSGTWDQIEINGVEYDIDLAASNWNTIGGSDETLALTASAGVQNGVAFEFGDPADNHQAAEMSDFWVLNNVVRHAPAFALWRHASHVQCCSDNFVVAGNLAEDLGERWGGVGSRRVQRWSLNGIANMSVLHNTLFHSATDTARAVEFAGPWSDDTVYVDNIAPGNPVGDASAPGQAVITKWMCGNMPCAATQFDKNAFPGGSLATYTVGTHWNLCQSTGSCPDPDFESMFEDYGSGDYRIDPSHPAYRAGTDGLSVGADPALTPRIEEVRAETGETKALLRIRLSPGAADWPCSARVSTDRDLRAIVSDIDVSLGPAYAAAYADNQAASPDRRLDRMIPLGIREDLAPGTIYYYALYCGGAMLEVPWHDKAFIFQTAAAGSLTGQGNLVMEGTPSDAATANRVIEYGTSYDRATDAIQSPSLGTAVACTTAAPCTVSFTADRGELVYFRTVDRDNGDQVLSSGPIQMTIVR